MHTLSGDVLGCPFAAPVFNFVFCLLLRRIHTELEAAALVATIQLKGVSMWLRRFLCAGSLASTLLDQSDEGSGEDSHTGAIRDGPAHQLRKLRHWFVLLGVALRDEIARFAWKVDEHGQRVSFEEEKTLRTGQRHRYFWCGEDDVRDASSCDDSS